MATRQYIGARYVPKIADPVEWQTNVAYEPLTIVSRLGGSYTSRKDVPVGMTPENNPEFWAFTGNYNAQIELYRQETQEVLDNLKGIKYYVTPEMYGAKGDGINDDTKAVQDAINSGFPVMFSSKTYLISRTLTATNYYLLGNNTTIKANTNIGNMLTLTSTTENITDVRYGNFYVIRGITFDCGLLNSGIVRQGNRCQLLTCCSVCNFIGVALNDTAGEVYVDGLSIYQVQPTTEVPRSTIGIRSNNDNSYHNVTITDVQTGFYLTKGGCYLDMCRHWLTTNWLYSDAVFCITEGDNTFNWISVDTVKTGIRMATDYCFIVANTVQWLTNTNVVSTDLASGMVLFDGKEHCRMKVNNVIGHCHNITGKLVSDVLYATIIANVTLPSAQCRVDNCTLRQSGNIGNIMAGKAIVFDLVNTVTNGTVLQDRCNLMPDGLVVGTIVARKTSDTWNNVVVNCKNAAPDRVYIMSGVVYNGGRTIIKPAICTIYPNSTIVINAGDDTAGTDTLAISVAFRPDQN